MAPAVRRASTQAPPALPIVAQFHEFVRPLANPVLTPFCTALTSISQDVVDGADPFPAVFGRAQAFLRERGLAEHNAVVVTCGDWDLRMMLPRQAKLTAKLALQAQQTQVSRDQNHTQHAMHDGDGAPKQQPRAKVPIPAIFRRWINIKAAFASHFSETSRINGQRAGDAAPPPLPPAAAAASLSCMLRSLGWEFEGHHHLGLDDTRNIARIAAHMVATGWMPSKEQTRYA